MPSKKTISAKTEKKMVCSVPARSEPELECKNQFVVHHKKDDVGVAVTDISKGEKIEGWNMESNSTFTIEAVGDIPLGHKIALRNFKKDESVVKYGVKIGMCTQDISVGEHVHTHNIKTARW